MITQDGTKLAPVAANDNLPRLVALTGKAGAGKSTAADYLVKEHGYVRVRFAGPLKAMMRAIGLGDAEIEGDLKERPCALLGGVTPRHAMQTLGTEWGRDCIGHDFWIQLWARTARDVLDEGGRVVVEDCRFPNEALAVRSFSGTIVRIEGRGGIAGSHSSEGYLPVADAIVKNTAGVADLNLAVAQAIAA